MTADDAGATTGSDLIRINVSSTDPIYGVVCEFQQVSRRRLLYKLHFYGIRGSTLKRIASWPSEHYQNGWPSIRPSSGLISCPSRIGLGTSPVLDFHK